MINLHLIAGALTAIALQTGVIPQAQTVDKEACEANGGHVERFGKAKLQYCVKLLRDAGKACAKKTDCLGECLAVTPMSAGKSARGRCQGRDEPLRGCLTRFDNEGKEKSLCID